MLSLLVLVIAWLVSRTQPDRPDDLDTLQEELAWRDMWDAESEDGVMYCQDCGRMISWDCKGGDDILRPAYVTASGDLFCDWCGSRYDEEEERQAEEEWGWMDDGDYP